ncbi:MAG: NAD(+) diphosphatase [Alphaproteobacteria bacterium]
MAPTTPASGIMLENPNTFANNPLDRAAHLRKDEAWLKARLADPSTLIVPLWRLKPMVIPSRDRERPTDVGWLRPGALEGLVAAEPVTVFLGLDQERDIAYFALELRPEADPEQEGPLAGLGSFVELRDIAMRVRPGDAAILAQAKSLVDWHARHRFCANCGAPTRFVEAGYRRDCPSCGAQHFPRTDPVVIMLPVRGDTCLLGRGPRFPRGMFSALAGFIEPGETIEDAVRREVMEETGVATSAVRFLSTQPWPYPSSLMIGCLCDAESEDIAIDGDEIAEARWFTRDAVRRALKGEGDGSFWVPPRMAIAHQIIKVWVEEG